MGLPGEVQACRALPGARGRRTTCRSASGRRYSSRDRQEILPSDSEYRWLLSPREDGCTSQIIKNLLTARHRSPGGALRSVATRSAMFEENAGQRFRLVPASCVVCDPG